MINRRSFLHSAVTGGVGALVLCHGTHDVAARKLGKFGVQLYTLRNDLQKDFEGTIARR